MSQNYTSGRKIANHFLWLFTKPASSGRDKSFGKKERSIRAQPCQYCGAVLPEIAAMAVEGVTKAYHNDKGTHMQHSVLSLSPDDSMSYADALEIAKKAIKFYDNGHQIVAAVHTDHPEPHIHFALNTTNFRTGRK